MSDLEQRLLAEYESWQKQRELETLEKQKKSKSNAILVAILASSLLTAAVTEGIQIAAGEFGEDVKRCELSLDFLTEAESKDFDLYSPDQAEAIKREVVEMALANCHIDTAKDVGATDGNP